MPPPRVRVACNDCLNLPDPLAPSSSAHAPNCGGIRCRVTSNAGRGTRRNPRDSFTMQRTSHHPPPHEPLPGGHVDRRARVRLRSLAGRHRPAGRLLAPPAPARVRRDRQHDVPRAPDRACAWSARPSMLRHRGADRPRGRPPRRLPPARAVRQGVPPPPRRRPLGLPRRAGRCDGFGDGSRRRRPARLRPLPAPPGRGGPYVVALHRGRPIGCCRHGPEESTPRRERERTVQQMVIVGVIASAVGIALGLSIHWFPPAGSTQAEHDRHALGRPASSSPSRCSCSSR